MTASDTKLTLEDIRRMAQLEQARCNVIEMIDTPSEEERAKEGRDWIVINDMSFRKWSERGSAAAWSEMNVGMPLDLYDFMLKALLVRIDEELRGFGVEVPT